MEEKSCKGGLYCVAVNCHNNSSNDGPRGVKFYRFPADKERREVWIRRLNRLASDGTLWRPTQHCRICSEHFLGGEKSNEKGSPSYHPSIFPTGHVKPQTTADKLRFERQKRRAADRRVPTVSADITVEEPEPADAANHEVDLLTVDAPKLRDFGVQTDSTSTPVSCTFAFELDIHSSTEKGTSANIPQTHSASVEV